MILFLKHSFEYSNGTRKFMNVDPTQWLSLVTTNYMEEEVIELLKRMSAEPIIYKYPITKTFNPGTFELFDIGTLRTLINSANSTNSSNSSKSTKQSRPILTLYVRSTQNLKGKNPDMHKWFDTSSLQIHLPELLNTSSKKPILFQVASNFNCQENGSVYTSLTSNHYLTNLMTDSTQGPSASGGAGLGAIERLRYHLQKPINLLSAFSQEARKALKANKEDNGDYIEVQNGKLTDWSDSLDVSKLDINDVKIGLHTGLSANFDRSNRKRCYFYEKGVPIDQVFVSTICLPDKIKTYKKGSKGLNLAKELDLAVFLLKAAYEGTYLAARHLESRQLVLTFIGGGVFNNPFELIIEAIANAHLSVENQYLEEVILPIFDPTVNHLDVVKLLERYGLPKELIRVYLMD